MNRWIVPLAVALLVFSCSQKDKNMTIEQKIERIENGLVEIDPAAAQQVFQTDSVGIRLEQSLQERMQELKVPGLSLVVIDDFEIAWAKTYGVLEQGKDVAVTPETCFEAASTSKLLASVATLKLVEEGLLDLDQDVNGYLKSWQIPENLLTQDQKVTLRLLLTHQAGINRPEGGFGYEEGSTPTLVQVLKGELPAANQAAFVEFIPGSQHQYSNMGFLIIQMILEDVAGKPYSEIIRQTVFDPLGMKSSTFQFPFSLGLRLKVVKPHDEEGLPHDNALHAAALAHGGLVTTPRDLALLCVELMKAYQGRSGRLLSQNTVQQMFTPELELDASENVAANGQGLGVFLIVDEECLYFLHPGYNYPGSVCMLFASPTAGKGAVIMANSAGGWRLSLGILAAVANEYGWPKVRY